MTDPIQHLRDLHDGLLNGADQIGVKGGEYIFLLKGRMAGFTHPDDHTVMALAVAAINNLPALLDLWEAARKVREEYDSQQDSIMHDSPNLPSIECDLSDAIAKLEKP